MKAIDRFYEYLAEKSLKPTAVEKEIGLSNGYLSIQRKRSADMGEGMMLKIIDYFRDINPIWLLTGNGTMFRDKEKKESDITSVQLESETIPIVDISVAAGSGYDNPDFIEVVNSITMPQSMIERNRKYYCVKVRGESMSPTLLDSSYLVLKLLNRNEWRDIKDNHIYVISDREGRSYVKRIKNRLSEHGFIVCTSDNVDKVNYPNFNIMGDEINTVLYAEWYLSAKMPNINATYFDKVNHLEDDMDILKNQISQIMKCINTTK